MRRDQSTVSKPRKLRLERGVSQDRAALDMGISRFTLYQAERAPDLATRRTLGAIAKYYGVTPEELAQ